MKFEVSIRISLQAALANVVYLTPGGGHLESGSLATLSSESSGNSFADPRRTGPLLECGKMAATVGLIPIDQIVHTAIRTTFGRAIHFLGIDAAADRDVEFHSPNPPLNLPQYNRADEAALFDSQ